MVAPRHCTNPDCRQPLASEEAGLCVTCGRGTMLAADSPSLRDFLTRSIDTLHEIATNQAETRVDDVPALPATEGTTLRIGRFVVQRFLGEGVFGRVYLAHDPHLDRLVALKVAKAEHLASPERRERFFREARAAANLRHPHIVPLFDMGQDGERAYLVSAYISGRSLEAHLRAAPKGLAFDTAARIVMHLAEALAYAHGQGIVHRDVKPANILLEETDSEPLAPVPMLMDFGLAARSANESRLTHDGTLLGTPMYLAPELCDGSCGDPLPTSDLYSLGVVLYELLTGQPPFIGTLYAVLHQHKTQAPPPMERFRSNVPMDLQAITLKCLAKDPDERYESCQELANDLRRYLDHQPIGARQEKSPSSAGQNVLSRWLQRVLRVWTRWLNNDEPRRSRRPTRRR